MPTCNCETNGCLLQGGVQLPLRTVRDHAHVDQANRYERARIASEEALRDQEDAIATHLASMTLADQVSELSQDGGRLWGKSLPNHDNADQPANDPPSTADRTTHRQRIDYALTRLCSLEKDLNTLNSRALLQLLELGTPSAPNTPFPLKPLIVDMRNIMDQVSGVNSRLAAIRETKSSILTRCEELQTKLKNAQRRWVDQAKEITQLKANGFPELNTEHHFQPLLAGVDPIIQVSLFLVVSLHVILNTSRRGSRFMLGILGYIIKMCFARINSHLSQHDRKVLSDVPRDPDNAEKEFNLEAKAVIYAVCPNERCHKTHKPSFSDGSPIPTYRQYCNHARFPGGSKCGERLTRPRLINETSVEVPIKTFVSFDFKDWVAGLLSRPGSEDRMDAAWETVDAEEIMYDIFQGEYLRNFKGHDGLHFNKGGHEGRYAFSLCVDFFNPYTNKLAGKKTSIGLISLVCLNLPPSLRYKPENMFLAGIVPGPREPPLTTLNHYLTPLIDDLVEFWEPGVRFTRTYNYPEGRTIRCALIALVSDLPASRKTAGFAAHSHEHFCSICHCTRSNDQNSTDYSSWKRRTNDECRSQAAKYETAPDEEARACQFEKYGIRWSELLRLPYFDIVRCVVVDAMHNLFLGLIKEHLTGILGISLQSRKAKTPVISITFSEPPSDFTTREKQSLIKLHKWLSAPMSLLSIEDRNKALKKLKGAHAKALEFACTDLGCAPAAQPSTVHKRVHTKDDWVVALVAWRQLQHETRETGAETSTEKGHVLSEEEMKEIWSDIENIVTPTWMTSVPSNLGSPDHGKLKADQWRALGTLYLPISLIKLWGMDQTESPRGQRCREILGMTVSLLSAVIIASSRTTSAANADAYFLHMQAYLNDIKRLFPVYKLRPNHHMALHLHEYLRLFGPVHAWWTFPFERVIGMLQRTPHNSKIGELEQTIARSYTRSANLRALMSKSECPEALKNCHPVFLKLVNPQVRDTLTTDINALTSLFDDVEELDDDTIVWNDQTTQIFPEVRQALSSFLGQAIMVPQTAQFLTHLKRDGLTYGTSYKHAGNSRIMLKSSRNALPIAARIEYIFQLCLSASVKTFVAFRRYQRASISADPFSCFPVLQGQVLGDKLGTIEITEPAQLTCHFGYLPIEIEGEKVFLAVPLSRDWNEE